MNRKYSIGFLIATVASLVLIGFAYNQSYNYALENKDIAEAEVIYTEGQAVNENCFYLMEKNGFVVVYENDRKTIYEYTNIQVAELPYLLQNEIKNGKYIKNMEELYGFLENYSS